jgi:methenyltetrahydrofolate cyclohydrolase
MSEATAARLTELLTAVAERSPAPGAGCAIAWTGALAASLLEMASAYVGADALEAQTRAPELRAVLLQAGEAELSSYQPVLAAVRLARDDPSRDQRLKDALLAASVPPLAIARASAEVARLAAEVAAKSKPALTGDATAGVLLAEAACQSAARLIEINLAGRGEDPRLGEVARLREAAERARARVLGR